MVMMMRSFLRLVGRNKAYVAMIFIQIISAGLALFSKAAIAKGMNPFVFVVYRQAFAFFSLSPFAFFFDRKQDGDPLSFKLVCKIFFVSLLGLTLATNLYSASLNYVSATLAAAFSNIIPAVTFIMAVIFRVESVSMKEIYGKAKIVGTILSLGGAIVFGLVKGPAIGSSNNDHDQRHHNSSTHSKADQVKGVIMMLASNVSMGLWLILQGFVVKKYPAKLRFTALQCLFCCTQTGVVAVIMERDPSAWKLGWDINLLSVVYCGVIVTGITYWVQLRVIEERGAVFSALFTPLALIITALFSALVWHDTLHFGSIGGMILVVIRLYSVLWGKNAEQEQRPSHENENTHHINHTHTSATATTTFHIPPHNAPSSTK